MSSSGFFKLSFTQQQILLIAAAVVAAVAEINKINAIRNIQTKQQSILEELAIAPNSKKEVERVAAAVVEAILSLILTNPEAAAELSPGFAAELAEALVAQKLDEEAKKVVKAAL
jgi:hypothetical protein